MRVAGLTTDGDWRFGRGKALYLTKSEAVRQNVVTRLRSFQNDYFADVTAGIDWITILGTKGNEQRVLRDIETTVLTTTGVRSIDRLEIVRRGADRSVTIELRFTDLFDESFIERVALP